MTPEVLVHETSYRKRNLVGWIHRNRLQAVAATFDRHVGPGAETWADFGCSNGFIIAEIAGRNPHRFRRIVGYEYSADLLQRARARGLPGVEFIHFDLNETRAATERFDVVTCLETLEHVGDADSAIANLVARMAPGGLLFITVPNETGFPGLVKFFGRLATRRRPYDDFFARGRRADYVTRLLLARSIDGFREPGRRAYGPHLGFDYRTMKRGIEDRYVRTGVLAPMAANKTTLGMNVLLLYRRRDD